MVSTAWKLHSLILILQINAHSLHSTYRCVHCIYTFHVGGAEVIAIEVETEEDLGPVGRERGDQGEHTLLYPVDGGIRTRTGKEG